MQAVATAVALPLAQSTYPDIKPVLDAAMRDDHASGDDRLQWLVVTDATGQVVAATQRAPAAAASSPSSSKLLATAPRTATSSMRGSATARTGSTARRSSSATTSVGALRIGVSTAGLEAELAKSLAQRRRAQQGVAAAAAADRARSCSAIGVVLAALQGVSLARPIKHAHRAGEQDRRR